MHTQGRQNVAIGASPEATGCKAITTLLREVLSILNATYLFRAEGWTHFVLPVFWTLP
jgi:hypothetical protein